MLAADVITRLKARVPTLRSVEGAADWQALMLANELPQNTPAAFVIPIGLRGGAESSLSNPYVQDVEEAIGIVLTFRGPDTNTARALEQPDSLRGEVLGAVLGWGPDTAPGVFRLVQSSTQVAKNGLLVVLIQIAIQLQLRIS